LGGKCQVRGFTQGRIRTILRAKTLIGGGIAVAKIERSIYIEAPPEAVQALIVDTSRWGEWSDEVDGIQPDDVWPHAGGEVSMAVQAPGVSGDLKYISREYTPGRSMSLEIEGLIRGTVRYICTPEGSGMHLTVDMEYELPGGILGKAIDRLVMERQSTDNLDNRLARMKAVLEG
jgi:coenzyme Q-binding protein COQ10